MHPAALLTRSAQGMATLVLSLLWSSLAGAVEMTPEQAGLFLRKGDVFFNDQRYQEAINWYEQATVADPAHAHAFTMLAAAHYMAGGVSSAMRNFDKALDIEPSSLNALLRSGQLHLQVCNLDRAERDFAAIRNLEPQHEEASAATQDIAAVRKRLAAAQKLADKDDWDNVGDALEHVYELAPDCIDAMLISGQARLEGGDFEGCVMETGRVLKIQPNHVDALILRGEAHFLMEDFDMAKRHYGMVLTQYDPENEQAKVEFKAIKKYQKEVAKLKAVLSRRNWTEIETEVSKGLEDIEVSHTALRTELQVGLAKALLHLGRPADKAALQHGYNEDVVIIKVKTFMRDERWEAAVQAAEGAMQEHGRSEKLRTALRDAKLALKKSKVKDYYKILGVDKDVDDKTLKKVYRRLALQNHPDKADGDKTAAEKKFADINEAYEILSDPEKRELHDAGEDATDPNAGRGFGGGHGFGQPFNFGGQTFNVRFG